LFKKKEREPWEKSDWEKCENKRGRILVLVVGVGLCVNAFIQPFFNLTMLSIVGIVAMLVIAMAFYNAAHWTRILITISAFMAPISSANTAVVRHYADANQTLYGLSELRILNLAGQRFISLASVPLFELVRPVITLLFAIFVIYVIFFNESTVAYLKNIRDRRRPPFKRKRFAKKEDRT